MKDISKFSKIGATLSVALILLTGLYFYSEWPIIIAMKPNEFGDLMAGILGPFALLWLVLGFFQQGEELRHSVRALELQSEELKNSVEQQAALVEVTRKQAEAELQALTEERETRRKATNPHFQVRQGHLSRSGDKVIRNFHVLNTGDLATNVSVVINGHKSGKHKLETGQGFDFPVLWLSGAGPGMIDIIVSAENRYRASMSQSFCFQRVSLNDDAMYVEVD